MNNQKDFKMQSIQSSDVKRLIQCFVILAMIEFSVSAVQTGYYNSYYPYRPLPYATHPIPRYQARQQATAVTARPGAATATATAYRQNNYYNSNRYVPTAGTTRKPATSNVYNDPRRDRISRADAENAKFAGASNQESDVESSRTLKRKLLYRRNRCLPFLRDATSGGNGISTTPSPQDLGRFLWDVNIYNVYPNGGSGYGSGCGGIGGGLGSLGGLGGLGSLGGLGGLGGGLGLGGLLSDPIAPAYPQTPLANFLTLFAPGILQNALAATARPPLLRPQLQADPGGELNDLQSDPDVDPTYNQRPPIRRPNQVYFDSAGAPPITPAQLVGGVATTVNGIIQQLTGNVQPVYPG